MPWCEPCAKYWTPNAMNDDGTCPTCGEPVLEPHDHVDDEDAEIEEAPWHFQLMVIALIIYLGWRLISIVV